jgi:EAL domain-containing protein (putative c-di-GMP-specific phosphodiesterase class I)/GGDEF domain-containing protein/CBS domain-containing protein
LNPVNVTELNGQTELEKQLVSIINRADVRTVFQPIISLRDGSVFGYEALSRGPAGSPLENPDTLFGVATECGKLWELELLCRTKALETAYRNQFSYKLFINVNPSIIHDEKFKQGFTKEYLKEYHIDPSEILFEISEKDAVADLAGFKKTIDHYKNQNYRIAIDDAGAGYSGLNMIADVHPHFIKLDMKLIRDIEKDAYKKALVKSLWDFCCVTEISLIAEGVETEEELRALIDIGVPYAQGYFIQYPKSEITYIAPHVLEAIQACNAKKNQTYRNVSNLYVGNLCSNGVIVPPDVSVEYVYNLFLKDDNLMGVTVVEQNMTVLGAVSRSGIERTMSGQYGYSLHSKRSISSIMNTKPLITDVTTPIDIVSKLAMARPQKTMYDFIVVTQQSVYIGVATIKDILEKTMEIEVFNSRQLNPLSGLPGNLMIEKNFEKFIVSKDPCTILYIDLDNFKAYNDVYGFGNGDKVIQFVAQMLAEIMPSHSFLGHIGGDDFVVILNTYDVEVICNHFIRQFDKGIRGFYSERDLNNGYIIAKNRRDEEEQFPIMSVSVAGVSNEHRVFHNVSELAEYASALKKQCKLIWKSCHVAG